MKTLNIFLIVVGIVFLFLTTLQIRSCINGTQSEKISNLEGRIQSHKEEIAEKEKEWKEKEERLEEEIVELKDKVIESQRVRDNLKTEMEEGEKEASYWKEQFQLAKTDEDRIFALKKQVKSLEENYKLALDYADEWKATALYWKHAYEKESLKTKDLTEQKIERMKLLEEYEEEIGLLKKRQRQAEIFSKIERYIELPLAIYGGVKIIQGVTGK